MARRPSVFVRPLSMDEGRKIQKITRTAKDPVRLRRAIVVMMSGQGQTVRDITSLLQVSDDYVRDVIHALNERGFDALDPKPSGGHPKRIGEQLRTWICTIARTSPADWGITGFSTWSLTKLRDDAFGEQVIAELGQRPGREAGQAALGGGRPGDQADPLADLLTDPAAASPAPFWVQRVEPPLVERVDPVAHVVLADLQQPPCCRGRSGPARTSAAGEVPPVLRSLPRLVRS